MPADVGRSKVFDPLSGHAMGTTIPGDLTKAQTDGLACVVCGADYLRVSLAHVPVGRSRAGSQVFVCVGACERAA